MNAVMQISALFDLMALFWGHPQCVLSLKLLQKTLAEAETTSTIDARMAVNKLRSYLHYLGFDDCIVTFRGRGYQFVPPNACLQDRRMAAHSTGRKSPFTDHPFSVRRFGAAAF